MLLAYQVKVAKLGSQLLHHHLIQTAGQITLGIWKLDLHKAVGIRVNVNVDKQDRNNRKIEQTQSKCTIASGPLLF